MKPSNSTGLKSAKLTSKSIAFSIGVSDEDFDLLKSAIGDGHGDNDATTNGKRRNGRTRLGHTLQLGWEYYSIAKIVDIGENIVGAAKVAAMLHLQGKTPNQLQNYAVVILQAVLAAE